jgi:hypothetical protein
VGNYMVVMDNFPSTRVPHIREAIGNRGSVTCPNLARPQRNQDVCVQSIPAQGYASCSRPVAVVDGPRDPGGKTTSPKLILHVRLLIRPIV